MKPPGRTDHSPRSRTKIGVEFGVAWPSDGGIVISQSAQELRKRIEDVDLWPESTNDDRCDNCRYYQELREGIGYCAHREVDMVVGGPWWCKLWAPNRETAAARGSSA